MPLLFWLSFPKGICFLLRRQEGCGYTDQQQVPCGNDNQKSENNNKSGNTSSHGHGTSQEVGLPAEPWMTLDYLDSAALSS